MPKIFIYNYQYILAGLTWGPCKPSGLLHRTPLAANDLALHWDDRTALVPDEPEYIGKASLLSILAGYLSEEELIGRVFCAYDIPQQKLFFAAVLVNGKPAIGAERLFDTSAELVAHIEAECSNGQIDRLAIDPYLAEDIAEDVTRRIAGCYLCPPSSGPTPVPVCVEGKPASKMPFGLAGWKIAAGAGASVLTLAAGILLWVSVQPSEPAISAPRIAAVQTTFRDEAGFARNCLAAFAGIWPQAPGWQMTSEGCATPAMRDPALTGFAPGKDYHDPAKPDIVPTYNNWRAVGTSCRYVPPPPPPPPRDPCANVHGGRDDALHNRCVLNNRATNSGGGDGKTNSERNGNGFGPGGDMSHGEAQRAGY